MSDISERITSLSVVELERLIQQVKEAQSDLQRPIKPHRRQGARAPLSFAQQRLCFLSQLQPDSAHYNLPGAARLIGHLNIMALERVLNEIVERHESLRTRFVIDGQEWIQVIMGKSPCTLPIEDLSEFTAADREARVQRLAMAEASQPFDLASGSSLRVRLLRLQPDEHILLFTMHHLASDAWSIGVMIKEVAELYHAFTRREPSPLLPLPIQYADYALWQREWLQGDALERQLAYWRKQLSGTPPMLELPTDRPRPAVQSHRGARLRIDIGKELTRELRVFSRREGVTLFMTLLAAFKLLLGRYSGQSDLCIGTSVANRSRAETEPLIGFFVNTLVLRTDLSGDPDFRQLLGRVKETTLGALAHQDLPFERLVEELQPERSLSYTPLFQVMIALRNIPRQKLSLGELQLETLEIESGTSKFDLSLNLAEEEDRLSGEIEYSTDLFEAARIERLHGHYTRLLEAIVADPSSHVSQLQILTPAERRQLLIDWNQTGVEYGEAELYLVELSERHMEQIMEAAGRNCEKLHTPIEEELMLMWAESLRASRAELADQVFTFNDHLPPAQLFISKAHERFQVEITLRQLCESSNVAALAEIIELSQIKLIGEDTIATLSASLSRLSEEEAAFMLELAIKL